MMTNGDQATAEHEETYIVQLPSGRVRLTFYAGRPTSDDLMMLREYITLMERAISETGDERR